MSRIGAVDATTFRRSHQADQWGRWVARAAAAQAQRRAEAELRGVDTRVRAHEKTHLAVGGSVQIDLHPVPGNPEGTLRKAEALLRAALSPGADRQPSGVATRGIPAGRAP